MGTHDKVKNLTDKMQWRVIEGRWAGDNGGEADIITRYTDIAVEVPKHDLDAIAAYLKSSECFDKFYVDSALVLPPDSTWRTVEVVVDEGSQQEQMRKRRLLHTIARTDQGSSVAVITENGCRYRITYTWHEGETAVTAASQSTSGVGYRNMNAQRDSKTGLWSWIEEKRERLVQTTGVYVGADDLARQTERRETTGVRDGDLDEDASAVSLWDVDIENQAQGVLVNERRSKNEDCTVDIQQERVTSKARSGTRQSVTQTMREKIEEKLDSNQSAAVIDAVAAAGGVITRRESVANEDGTFDNVERTTTEKLLESAETRILEDEEKSITETLNEGAASAGELGTATTGQLEEVFNRRTDGGLWNVRTIVSVFKKWLEQIASKFVSLREERESVTHRCLTLEETNVYIAALTAGGGKRYEWRRSKRADGKYDLEISEFTEKLRNVRKGTLKTMFEHRGWEEKIESAAAAAAGAPAGGTVYENSSEESEAGLFRNRYESRAAQLVDESGRVVDVLPVGKRLRSKARNKSTPPEDVTTVGKSVIWDYNEYGAVNTEEVQWDVTSSKEELLYEQTMLRGPLKIKEQRKANVAAKLEEELEQTPGTMRIKISERNDRSSSMPWDTILREETATKWMMTDTVPDAQGDYIVMRYGNYKLAEQEALIAGLVGDNTNSWSPQGVNAYGLYDGAIIIKPHDENWKNKFRFEASGLVEYTQPVRTNREGSLSMMQYKLIYDIRLDWGVSTGLTGYDGAKWGSWFRHLGGDWFYYKKVTNVYVREAPYTPNASGWVEV